MYGSGNTHTQFIHSFIRWTEREKEIERERKKEDDNKHKFIHNYRGVRQFVSQIYISEKCYLQSFTCLSSVERAATILVLDSTWPDFVSYGESVTYIVGCRGASQLGGP